MNKIALAAAVVLAVAAFPSMVWSGGDGTLCELPKVDRELAHSRTCLACHDGSIATAVHQLGPDSASSSHPVEVDYRRAAAQTSRRLTPVNQLSTRLVLADGMVTCTTCHDPKSNRADHLAMPMEGSAMCLACHKY